MMMRLRVERNTRSKDLEKSVGGSSAMSSRVCIDVCVRASFKEKMEIFESQIRHKKSAHERKHHTLTDEKREREGASLEALFLSLSLSVSVSLFLSLSVRVCSEVIYKKRDVSIDDDQQRGTR